jgi:hypothetical protein
MDTSALEKKITMQLIEKLIASMDDHEFAEMKGGSAGGEAPEGEPVAIMEEKRVMPMSEAPGALADKMQDAMDADEGVESTTTDEDGEKPMFGGFARGKKY